MCSIHYIWRHICDAFNVYQCVSIKYKVVQTQTEALIEVLCPDCSLLVLFKEASLATASCESGAAASVRFTASHSEAFSSGWTAGCWGCCNIVFSGIWQPGSVSSLGMLRSCEVARLLPLLFPCL